MYFSIILPIYKVEEYLRECIDSILKQKFTDYELILVDDGSPDNCPVICDEYAETDNRIKVIHKQNGGISDARNVGTAEAKGEYIIYVDSDDFIITDDFLGDIYNKTVNDKKDIVLYKFQKYFENSGLKECSFSFDFDSKTDMADVINGCVKNDAYYGMAWCKAIKKSVIVDNEIEFEKGLLGEDMEWYFHILLCSKSIGYIDKSYIAYRQRVGSISTSVKLKNLTDFLYVVEKWYKGVSEADIDGNYKTSLFGALAKYYSNLLIIYTRVNDKTKKQYKKRIKQLSVVLEYAFSQRPKIVSKVYRLFGFNVTILMLKILDKIKG